MNKKQLSNKNDVSGLKKTKLNKTKTLAIKFGSVEKSSIFAARFAYKIWVETIKTKCQPNAVNITTQTQQQVI